MAPAQLIVPRPAALAALVAAGFCACGASAAAESAKDQGPAKNVAWICNDYHSKLNCVGQRYLVSAGPQGHRGIDFGAPAGTEVLSATHGTIANKTFDDCVGHQITIKTQIWRVKDQVHDCVHAVYAHTEPIATLTLGQRVKPGDLIGRIIPLRKTPCYGSREHVHLELRVGEKLGSDIDPNEFWVDGPSKVTCWKEGMNVATDRIVAPVRCNRVRKK